MAEKISSIVILLKSFEGDCFATVTSAYLNRKCSQQAYYEQIIQWIAKIVSIFIYSYEAVIRSTNPLESADEFLFLELISFLAIFASAWMLDNLMCGFIYSLLKKDSNFISIQ